MSDEGIQTEPNAWHGFSVLPYMEGSASHDFYDTFRSIINQCLLLCTFS